MRLRTLHTVLMTGTLMAISSTALAGQSSFCQDGTISSDQQSVDCAGRWVSADGGRFGPLVDPRDTPKTPHPYYQASNTSAFAHSNGHGATYSTHHDTAPAEVWTPPAPYRDYGTPVVVTRGNGTNTYDGTYDVYVPTPAHHGYRTTGNDCGTHSGPRQHGAPVLCGTHNRPAPIEGCFTLDQSGQNHAVACPVASPPVYSSAVHSTATAIATAHASATVNISNAGFLNGLSGGVGGSAPSFFGGGGSTVITSGGGSVLSRAPLLRFRTRNRGGHGGHGGGGGCGCGGGMMGMGGGD